MRKHVILLSCFVYYNRDIKNYVGGICMNQNVVKKASDIIQLCTEAYVGYTDLNNYPHVGTRSIMKANSINSCYFSTNTDGDMAQSIMKNSKGSVCFRLENDNITLVGDYVIVKDNRLKENLWQDWYINHYPGGASDPNYCLIKFTTKYMSFWIDHQYIKGSMDVLNQI